MSDSDRPPIWDGEIETLFNDADIGCMRDDSEHRALDLGSYESLSGYIRESNQNKQKILDLLQSGKMPKGGPQWDEEKYKRFKEWVDWYCPKTKQDLLPPQIQGW